MSRRVERAIQKYQTASAPEVIEKVVQNYRARGFGRLPRKTLAAMARNGVLLELQDFIEAELSR